MSGAILLFPLHAFMVWIRKTLHFYLSTIEDDDRKDDAVLCLEMFDVCLNP
jgi:hypothetical protein